MSKAVYILLLVGISVGIAQGSGGGFGGFAVSGLMLNLSSINDATKPHNMPELQKRALATGGMGFAIINRLLIGGEGFGSTTSSENDSIKISFGTGGGFFDIGYVLPIGEILHIYPIMGIGGIGHSLTLRPRLGDMSFNELLTNPKRTSTISTGSFAFNFSLGIHLLKIFGSPSFISLFLRAGYILELSKPDWEFDDGAQLFSGPDKNLSFPFATISILFGGHSKD